MNPFKQWYEANWPEGADENKTRGIYRFCIEHHVTHVAVYQALRGDKVGVDAAGKISDATGRVVSVRDLCFPAATEAA